MLEAGQKLLSHADVLGDPVCGLVTGYLVWSGLVPRGPEAVTLIERMVKRQLGPYGRELVAVAASLPNASTAACEALAEAAKPLEKPAPTKAPAKKAAAKKAPAKKAPAKKAPAKKAPGRRRRRRRPRRRRPPAKKAPARRRPGRRRRRRSPPRRRRPRRRRARPAPRSSADRPSMPDPADRIELHGLQVVALCGVLPEERDRRPAARDRRRPRGRPAPGRSNRRPAGHHRLRRGRATRSRRSVPPALLSSSSTSRPRSPRPSFPAPPPMR